MLTTSKITVPTIPTVAIRLLELYDDPDFDLQDIVELLRSDPALSAKILKAANSPAYGTGREVSDFNRAVSLLGKAVVTPLVLSFYLAEKSMATREAAELFRQYWLQAIVQAIASEYLAKQYLRAQAGEWFVAGLLSSIGRLALISHDSEKYQQVMAHAETYHVSLHEAERQLLETTTVDLSVELLREWHLPQRWVDATANQFRIVEALESLPERGVPHEQMSGHLGLRFDIPGFIPLAYELSYTLNGWNYFNTTTYFFEDEKPNYLVQQDSYWKFNISTPITKFGKLSAEFLTGSKLDNYYQTNQFSRTDTTDETKFEFYSPGINLEYNSLNRKQFASSGTLLRLCARYISGLETTYPGSTSVDTMYSTNYHNWYQIRLLYNNYFNALPKLNFETYVPRP